MIRIEISHSFKRKYKHIIITLDENKIDYHSAVSNVGSLANPANFYNFTILYNILYTTATNGQSTLYKYSECVISHALSSTLS